MERRRLIASREEESPITVGARVELRWPHAQHIGPGTAMGPTADGQITVWWETSRTTGRHWPNHLLLIEEDGNPDEGEETR